jgi:hypothetical protein
MPYEIRKGEKGWKVFTKGTDRSHSNKPLPLARAKAQLKALYASADDFSGGDGLIGGFDDRDFKTLFGMYGGAEDDDEPAPPQEESDSLVKTSDLKDFDVEDATGEPEYLKQAKAFAKKAGYRDASSLKLADDGKHKLILRGVKFGSINNNDYIIYKQHFPSIADKKRRQYLARATKIKGDWAKDRYSPNSLAINILWDGSSKKGGDFDWGGLIGDSVKSGMNLIGDLFKTPEQKEEERKRKEACEICNKGAGMSGGAVPINKKLYERVKAEVYPRYKKPSAYRSGAVVKRYKELGGKFKDDNGRPLARWFKEEWKDVGNWGKANWGALPPYPVYRPTERISKDTPLTPEEIDPENLQLQIKEKQNIRGESNLPPFKVKGGRLAQTDAEETKVAKQLIQKVAGEQNAEVKKIAETPMGDDNIRKYFPNATILTYKQLADVDNITELLPAPKTFFFLLYEQAVNTGHWVVINRYIDNGRDTICYFCSYGSKIDAPLRWNSPLKNAELGQDRPYLSELLRKSGKTIQYNRVQYQSKTSPVATCGAFATLWIKANTRDNMNLTDFHDWISEIKKETGLSYDAIASNAISDR